MSWKPYARTYESRPRHALANTAPTQSISSLSLIHENGGRRPSCGIPQKLIPKNTAFAAAHI